MTVRPKLFRDPVHDIISFDLATPSEATVYALLNTPEVQRLRRIRQLGMTFLVYHGAEHSRFCHSMGVTHLALKYYDRLFAGRHADEFDRTTVAAAALLHDIGHGPFSHVMERITGVHHENTTLEIIDDPGSQSHQILAAVDTTLPNRVGRLLQKQGLGQETILSDIVSSQLDADRLDYILRDAAATGVRIGTYDLARIIGMAELRDERITVHQRALEAVEGYLIARFHMYKQVYLHRAGRAAERMLDAVFRRVRHLLQAGYSFSWSLDHPGIHSLVSGHKLAWKDFILLDDADIWYALKQWAGEKDPILAELCSGLLLRRLYKSVEIDLADPRGTDGIIRDAREIARNLGFDPDFQLLVDHSTDTPYRPYQPGSKSSPIHMLDNRSRVVPIEKNSAFCRFLGEIVHESIRLVVPDSLRSAIRHLAAPEAIPLLL
ncbi:MAG: HD domain-containing protein [Myxococcales bacterium]|nr:HD domain-containing protein [Myxococcales bacterium]